MEGRHKLLQPMGSTIPWGDSWMRAVVVQKFGCVGRHEGFGEFGDHQLTAVVFEGDANSPTVFAAEIPGFVAPWLDMENHVDTEGGEWGSAVVELLPYKEVPRGSGGI